VHGPRRRKPGVYAWKPSNKNSLSVEDGIRIE
jgi:hypothetical protein